MNGLLWTNAVAWLPFTKAFFLNFNSFYGLLWMANCFTAGFSSYNIGEALTAYKNYNVWNSSNFDCKTVRDLMIAMQTLATQLP